MTRVDFPQDYYYNGPADDHRPLVVVRLFPPNGPSLTVNALLDTGAEYSIFSKTLAPALGIPIIGQGHKSVALMQPVDNSSQQQAFVYDINVEWLGYSLTVPIGFVPTWPDDIDNLLGMKGFFEELFVGIHHQKRTVFVTPASNVP